MASPRHVREAAAAIREHVHAIHDARSHHPRYAVVTAVNPIEVSITDTTLVAQEDDDLTLSQHVRWYDKTYGIVTGDALVVHLMPDGDWLASDVISQTDV